jgi:flavin reductase (DIM6/NTAB) family NADH-FMN oxidoreductase RutF
VGGSTVVIAEILAFHVQEELLDISHTHPSVKFEGYRPVSRLGGNNYGHVTDWYEILRPPGDAFKDWPVKGGDVKP